jgi:hypothetical protein
MIGELDAGKPHVQFDEGAQETCDRVTRLCPTLPESPYREVPFLSTGVVNHRSSGHSWMRHFTPRSTRPDD